jgi:hypothetical protein
MAAAVHNLETQTVQVTFVLELYDGVTGLPALAGTVRAAVAGHATPWQKPNIAQFVFFQLAPGSYTVNVASIAQTPYYLPVSIPITVPAPGALWPAFPDRTLADPTKLLSDPGQTAPYLAQRAQATLMPSAQYPFGAGATLLRGTVSAAGAPLAGAQVSETGSTQKYVTAADGQYVLFFNSVDGMGQTATIQAVCPPHASQTVTVTLLRGLAVSKDIVMV